VIFEDKQFVLARPVGLNFTWWIRSMLQQIKTSATFSVLRQKIRIPQNLEKRFVVSIFSTVSFKKTL